MLTLKLAHGDIGRMCNGLRVVELHMSDARQTCFIHLQTWGAYCTPPSILVFVSAAGNEVDRRGGWIPNIFGMQVGQGRADVVRVMRFSIRSCRSGGERRSAGKESNYEHVQLFKAVGWCSLKLCRDNVDRVGSGSFMAPVWLA